MSNASKPDGTDPRIVQETGETVVVSPQSRGRTYHNDGCDVVDSMINPKRVDKSVAEWSDKTPCRKCHDLADSGYTPDLNGEKVDRVRRALVNGIEAAEIAQKRPFVSSTIRYHARARREYNYEIEPELPPVRFSQSNQTWVWADE